SPAMVLIRCYCQTHECNGALVEKHVFNNHQRADLWGKTKTSQARFQRAGPRILLPSAQQPHPAPVSQGFPTPLHEPTPLISPDIEFLDPPRTSNCAIEQEMLDHGTLTGEDLDIMTFGSDLPNLGPSFHSLEALMNAVDHFTEYNAATSAGARPLTAYQAHQLPPDPKRRALERQLEHLMDDVRRELEADNADGDPLNSDDVDLDVDGDFPDDADDEVNPCNLGDNEDTPDPFLCEDTLTTQDRDLSEQPPHLIVIYALASWLHLQFHLPRVACNALLAIFAFILVSISPTISTPFVTLQSSNRVLGLDRPVHILPVCPSCRDVFPLAGSPYSHDSRMSCNIDIFLPSQTRRGNQRALKAPIVSYPYLPLSEQITSLLKIPGLEAVLDAWRGYARHPGEYIDIFDGAVCRTRLKGPDGKLFFSNNEDEKQGPNGELHLGVNLGVDWCVYTLAFELIL
ncbi:hypothetical protein PAXRUDRAFT_161651, partial [Paxillus rubicundulus Ve08.2h10]